MEAKEAKEAGSEGAVLVHLVLYGLHRFRGGGSPAAPHKGVAGEAGEHLGLTHGAVEVEEGEAVLGLKDVGEDEHLLVHGRPQLLNGKKRERKGKERVCEKVGGRKGN